MKILFSRVSDRVFNFDLTSKCCTLGDNLNSRVEILLGRTKIVAERIVLCAGAGAQQLLTEFGISRPSAQFRPLHQVIVRHPSLNPLYGHYIIGMDCSEPRITITSHAWERGWIWYLGGYTATKGVDMSSEELVDFARAELSGIFRWIDWNEAQFDTFRIDRVEPDGGLGPRMHGCAFVQEVGNCIVCWPNKLTLVPDLGDRVLALLEPPMHLPPKILDLPSPPMGRFPWEVRCL